MSYREFSDSCLAFGDVLLQAGFPVAFTDWALALTTSDKAPQHETGLRMMAVAEAFDRLAVLRNVDICGWHAGIVPGC